MNILCLVLGLSVLTASRVPAPAAPPGRTAATPMSGLGPENSQLASQVGTWDVVETVWASPEAVPASTHGVAERRMVGAFLQEILRPVAGSADILRIDYLSYNRVEGRWKYVSMDTRAPVGIMSAASFGRGAKGQIDLTFEPFALPGSETAAAGQLLQMRQVILRQDRDHDRKDQYFVPADGSGEARLAHRYVYARRH